MDAIVFLVDAVDKERFPESKKELDGLLSDDSLATVPFMVLGNKIDIPHAASEVRARLGWLVLAHGSLVLQLCTGSQCQRRSCTGAASSLGGHVAHDWSMRPKRACAECVFSPPLCHRTSCGTT